MFITAYIFDTTVELQEFLVAQFSLIFVNHPQN